MARITLKEVEKLARVIRKTGRDADIDWTNRQIVVLSEEKTHPTKIMPSTGKLMTYRDYLFHWSEKFGIRS